MPWQILFPHKRNGSQTTEVLPVVDGLCVVSGVGPTGAIRRLFAELVRTDAGGTLHLTGHTVRSQDVSTNHPTPAHRNNHQWACVFDFGSTPADAQGTYRIDLYVATGNTAPVMQAQLTGVKVMPLARLQRNTQYGGVTILSAGTIYPTGGSTMSATGLSAYGTVTVTGETVSPGGVDVDGTPAASGGMMPNGFWWVNFNPLTPGNNRTLTVNSSASAPERITINLQ